MSCKVEFAQPRFWLVALLGSALSLGACADEATPKKGNDTSSAGADDGTDDTTSDTDEGDSVTAKPKVDASVKPKVDASVKPKADAGVVDAKAPTVEDPDTQDQPDAAKPPKPTGDGGTSPATGDDGGKAVGSEHADLGKGDGKDVITIGDSWMNYFVNGGGIERGLLEASMQPYRTYGVAGTKLLDEVIPSQYEAAKRENPDIKTVVMTGGGNDLLLDPGADAKPTIGMIGMRLDKLWKEMAKDGVQDVIYIEYSEGGSNADNVKYGITQVQPICEGQTGIRCHFMLSDPIIMMSLIDGIHPTPDGCTKLGKAAFDLMVSEGMRR